MNRQTKLTYLLGAVGVLWVLSRTPSGQQLTDTLMRTIARGIRNNNPGNIRINSGTTWAGQSPQQTDPAFVQFTSPEFGIRAMAKVLKSYFARGVDTIEEVISTWAPASENNTKAYIAAVSKATGLLPTARISTADLPAVIAAIIHHENGAQPYDLATINKGVSLA